MSLDHLGLGNAYASVGESHRALEQYEHALNLARKIGFRSAEKDALASMGNVYKNLGEPLRALSYYEEALRIARELSDLHGEGVTLTNIGNVYIDIGDFQMSGNYFAQALEVLRATGDRRAEALTLFNRAVLYEKLHQVADAIRDGQIALQPLLQVEDPNADMVREQISKWRKQQNESTRER